MYENDSRVLIGNFCVAFIWLGLAAKALAQLPTAELHGLSRQVVQAGTACEIALLGNRLEEPARLVAYDMHGVELNINAVPRPAPALPLRDDQQTTTTFDILIDEATPSGLIEVRSVGRFGISNPRTILVGSKSVDLSVAELSNMATAHAIEAGHLVHGTTKEKQSNFYRCELKPGQRMQGVAYCKQLDSLADLSLRLLNQDGQLISSSRTVGQWPAEFMLANATSEEQTVYVEVRDLLYRGGPNFGFVMEVRVGDAVDDISRTQPMHLDELLRPALVLPLEVAKLWQPAGVLFAQYGWKEAIAVPTTPIESFPIRVQGDLLRTRIIPFHAQKDQSLSFEVFSASLDQLTDPAIVLYRVNPPKPDGTPQLQQLAEQDDAAYLGTPAVRVRRVDPQLVWKAPETSIYQLHLIDRQTGDRPNDSRRFLLEIRPPQPSFALIAHESFPSNNPPTAKPWGSQLIRNGAMQIHVSVLRNDGFTEPIELRVEGLPANCSCSPVVVPTGAVEADLIIHAEGDMDDSLAYLSIVGTAKHGEQILTNKAVAATISSAAIPTRNSVASRFTRTIALQLVNVDTAPLQLLLGDGSPLEVKAGSKVNLPVRLVRQPSRVAECTLKPQSLPPKVGLGEFKVAGDKSEASPELNVPADAPPGEYSFWLQAETKCQWRTNPQQLAREEAYVAKLTSALDTNSTGEFQRSQIEAALTQATSRVAELKKSTSEQEYPLFVPSNSIRIRILPKD